MPFAAPRASRLSALAQLSGFSSVRPTSEIVPELVQDAITEGVAPLIGARCVAAELHCPDELAMVLERAHRRCFAQNLMQKKTLALLTGALHAADVPALMFKGAALLCDGSFMLGERPMSDVDVLVPAKSWHRAVRAAVSAGGSVECTPGRPVTAKCDYAIRVRLGDVTTEIHRFLAPPALFSPDYAALFRAARPFVDGGLLPNPEHHFVIMAIHAAKHAYAVPFRTLLDGLALHRGHRLDSRMVARVARQWGARRATAAWIHLLQRFGLAESGWCDVVHELYPGLPSTSLLGGAPWTPGGSAMTQGLPRLRRIHQTLDRPHRMAVFLAHRIALRFADACTELVSGWRRTESRELST